MVLQISRIADRRIDKIEGAYTVGQTVKCRVVGHNHLDGIVNVGMNKSLCKQPFLRVEDIPVGSVVKVY